jgi:hypothetical protein
MFMDVEKVWDLDWIEKVEGRYFAVLFHPYDRMIGMHVYMDISVWD